MAGGMSIEITGVQELIKILNDMPADMNKSQGLISGFVAAERMVKANIQSEATFKKHTGILHAAIATYGKLTPEIEGSPGGFVKIKQKPGQPGAAPHGHLVEAGTQPRQSSRGYRGSMPANPFFARGVAKSKSLIASALAEGLKAFLKEHTK